MKTQPPIPVGDYLLYRDGRYASFGPRVDNGGHVEPPAPDQSPDFWSVYTRNRDDTGWQIYADVTTLHSAFYAAEAALMAVVQ